MKRLIQSAIAVTFCLPMAFAGCKDGCDCKKCADKDKEKSELADCDKCKKGEEKEKEGALA